MVALLIHIVDGHINRMGDRGCQLVHKGDLTGGGTASVHGNVIAFRLR